MPKTLGITAATVVKASDGRVKQISVVTVGTTAGSVNDCITTGAAAASNAIAQLPTTAGAIVFNPPWECGTGITVVPGTGQTIAIDWD